MTPDECACLGIHRLELAAERADVEHAIADYHGGVPVDGARSHILPDHIAGACIQREEIVGAALTGNDIEHAIGHYRTRENKVAGPEWPQQLAGFDIYRPEVLVPGAYISDSVGNHRRSRDAGQRGEFPLQRKIRSRINPDNRFIRVAAAMVGVEMVLRPIHKEGWTWGWRGPAWDLRGRKRRDQQYEGEIENAPDFHGSSGNDRTIWDWGVLQA